MSVVELIIFGAGGPRELVVDKANSKQRNSERLRIIFLKFFLQLYSDLIIYKEFWTGYVIC